MKVLFYLPLNNRCRNIESQALELKKEGHSIFLLTPHQHAGELHKFFEDHQFTAESFLVSSPVKGLTVLKYVLNLIRFCRKNKIDVVFSHVDAANLVAIMARYFVSAKIIVARHHADVLWLLKDYKNYYISKFIYKLAPTIEVVSVNAKKWMVNREGINANKINVIPISYNWDLFQIPDEGIVNEIRKKFNDGLVLSTAARFLPVKRIDSIIEVVHRLRNRGLKVKLLIFGDGQENYQLRKLVEEKKLSESIHFFGFIDNILPYLAASDLYVHFSESEASCVAVKEAALVKTPVMVCHNVGDFEEYLEDGHTALFVRKDHVIEDGVGIITKVFYDQQHLKTVGINLHDKVKKHFNVLNVMPAYNSLMKQS